MVSELGLSRTSHPTSTELHYFIIRPGQKHPGLSLFEAELYSSALIVQQLIGNLVYYSNYGRYEPRIAESWTNPNPYTWTFKLRRGFICENGEIISPASFRASLLRTFKQQEKIGGALIFQKLEGFRNFIDHSEDLRSVEASGDDLTFKFSTPVRDGVLETLSYAPYGYICADNFEHGNINAWKDDIKFVSSGPYQVEHIDIGHKVVISKRKGWKRDFEAGSPDKINFAYDLPAPGTLPTNAIVDVSARKPGSLDKSLEQYNLVPEYVSAIVLGNLEKGYFADLSNRLAFKKLLEANPIPAPGKDDLWTPSTALYPNQQLVHTKSPANAAFKPQKGPLRIQAKAPPKDGGGSIITRNLEKALIAAGLAHEFLDGDSSMSYFSDKSADIRIFGQSIGGEVRPWTLNVLFCSPLSYGYPDPTKKICRLVGDYNSGKLSVEEVSKAFLEQIEEDQVIFPVGHYGVTLYLSDSIDRTLLSPALSVPRFDQMRIAQ